MTGRIGTLREEPRTSGWGGASDTTLLVGINRHKTEALAEAFERHGADAFRIADHLCGREAASGVVHEVFLEFWRDTVGFDPESESLGRHLLSRTRRCALGDDPGSDAPLAAARVTPDSLVDLLPEAHRRVVLLTYFEGRTCHDASVVLDEPEATVHRLLGEALERLAVIVGDDADRPTR